MLYGSYCPLRPLFIKALYELSFQQATDFTVPSKFLSDLVVIIQILLPEDSHGSCQSSETDNSARGAFAFQLITTTSLVESTNTLYMAASPTRKKSSQWVN